MELRMGRKLPRKIKRKMYFAYYLFLILHVFFIIFGLLMDSPGNIINGMKNIFLQSNILLTDYIALGGIGAAFVNSGILSIMCVFILFSQGIKPTGATIAALWMVSGFAFFGKNILNVWPGIFGVWLYSKYQKEPFLNYVLIAIFGTALSPAVNELIYTGIFQPWQAIILGVSISIFMGFILPPIASYCIKLHQGYNLYNTGFAAGLLATLVMSVFRAFNIDFESRLLWSTGNNIIFTPLLLTLFLSMFLIGFFLNNKSFKNLGHIIDQPGRLISDFYLIYGKGPTFINMGIMGILSTLLVVVIGGEINGPTIGGIFTIVGFSAFGKNIRNVGPVVLGALLCGFLNIWELTSPGMILSILFCSGLAPISGHFGWEFGMIAGFLHVCVVKNMGYLHGGMNLYNNGFAAGIVAIVIVPVITAFRQKVHSSVHEYKKTDILKSIKKNKD